MRIVFMGTPDFAVPCLDTLIKDHQVVAVVTQPDRKGGRGNKVLEPAVKQKAKMYHMEVLQPENIKDAAFVEVLKKYEADMFIVVAYGQILSEEVLKIPKLGCINVHGSLLPKYRGAAPIQWSIINGETLTGVTTMFMDKGMDTGDMLIKSNLDIKPSDTYGTLHDKMAQLGARTLETTLYMLEKKRLFPTPQADCGEEPTYAPMINKDMECIHWEDSALHIHNLIRGLSPAPGAYTTFGGNILKCWKAEVTEGEEGKAPGEIIAADKNSFTVMTGEGGLKILEVQQKGGKKMDTGAFMRGHKIEVGIKLGE